MATAAPVLFALFVWWFGTGLVLVLDHLPRRTFRYSMAAATLVLAAALAGIHRSAPGLASLDAYEAFSSAVLAWTWVELGFYLGYVTGPRRVACAHGCGGWRHFGHALQANAHHELAILLIGGVIAALTWHQPNHVGLTTFAILVWLHECARLNVFLGVRNVDEEFLPEHLSHLRSFFARARMNGLFPVTFGICVAGAVVAIRHASALPAGSFAAVQADFVATLMGLGILEHLFLMLPLPSARLWRWSVRTRPQTAG